MEVKNEIEKVSARENLIWWARCSAHIDGTPLAEDMERKLWSCLSGRQTVDFAARAAAERNPVIKAELERSALMQKGETSRAALALLVALVVMFNGIEGVSFRTPDGREVSDVRDMNLTDLSLTLRCGNPGGWDSIPRVRP